MKLKRVTQWAVMRANGTLVRVHISNEVALFTTRKSAWAWGEGKPIKVEVTYDAKAKA